MKRAWKYTALNQNQKVMGTVFAVTKADAEKMIQNMGLVLVSVADPLSIEAVKGEPKLPHPVDSTEEKQEQEQITKTIESIQQVPVRERQEPSQEKTGRKQVFITGEQVVVDSKVNDLLRNCNGSVLQIQMRPNHHGIMIFAVVVEYEPKEKEKK